MIYGKKLSRCCVLNPGSEDSEELQYSAVHDGDLRKSHPELEGKVMKLVPDVDSGCLSSIRGIAA